MSIFLFILLLIGILFSEIIDEPMSNKRNLQTESNEFQNIRIHIDDSCIGDPSSTSDASQNRTDISLIKAAIQKAKNTLEKLIKVKRLTQTINLYSYTFPEEFRCATTLSNGVNADLAIIIRWTKQGTEYYDFPRSSIFSHVNNGINNRPLIGFVVYNFNLQSLGDTYEHKLQAASILFLHEFTHILGFNKTIFDNKNLIQTESVKNRINPREGNVDKLLFKGPKALDMAEKYFGCNNKTRLKGIELDDFNSKETQDGNSIHWSARILLGDYMISELYYTEQAISEITLAALEDLGYYEVNYFTGGLMRFGKKKGCAFIDEDCIEEATTPKTGLKTKFSNEFCSNIYEGRRTIFGTCSSGRQSMSYCFNLYTFDIIDTIDINYDREDFQEATSGLGNLKIIDFCPYSTSDVNLDELQYNYNGNCKIGDGISYSAIHEYIDEGYTETSFCAFSSLLDIHSQGYKLPFVKNIIRPTCYKMSCSEKSLTIHVGNEFIVCPQGGGIIRVDNDYSNYKGLIICPDYNLICTGTVLCNKWFFGKRFNFFL